MIEPGHPRLSIARQCKLVSVSRSASYYQPVPEGADNLALMRVIDEQFLETPCCGSRQPAAGRWPGTCAGTASVSGATAFAG